MGGKDEDEATVSATTVAATTAAAAVEYANSESGSGSEEESGSEYTDGSGGSSNSSSGEEGEESSSGSGSEESSSGSESESESEEEEEEPQLKYHRLGASVADILREHNATCMAVSAKFLVLATDWGDVHVLDSLNGTEAQRFSGQHGARINDVSIDRGGDYIATCADDGKVVVRSLYDPEKCDEYTFNRPVKSIAIDPEYARSKKRPFVTGGLAGDLVLNETSWGLFSKNKQRVLHAGEGAIHTVKWHGIFIAWANDLGVKIYDTTSQQRIAYVQRPDGSPRPDLYRCRLTWRDDATLLIGWANSVQVGVIKPRAGAGGTNLPSRCMELVAMVTTDFWVAGIAPFADNMVLLAYVLDEEDEEGGGGGGGGGGAAEVDRPELRILTMRAEEVSNDALDVRGYESYMANDYHLEYFAEESYFYVVSPKDIVVAKPCDLDDHITWLISKNRFEDAVRAAKGNERELRAHNMTDLWLRYIDDLLTHGEADKAAAYCPAVFGTDIELWEKWIHWFAVKKKLSAIAHVIPLNNPRLGRPIYEMTLNHFLECDHRQLNQTVKDWPPELYGLDIVIPAVEDHARREPDPTLLHETLAMLYTYDRQFDKALATYLRLGRGDVFGLIDTHNLFHSIQDKIALLLAFDAEKAVNLLVHNVDKAPVRVVVEQLAGSPEWQYQYLAALAQVAPHAGKEFGRLQVELTAEYHPDKLMTILKSSYVPLPYALKVCQERGLARETVFVLQRMGNKERALDMIINDLQDVQQAIEFVVEEKDDELWDDLIAKSMDKPGFVKGLLETVGTVINPLRLLKRAELRGMKIPGLQTSLVKILQDFNLQIELRKGCTTILTNDCVTGLRNLQSQQKRGMLVDPAAVCQITNDPIGRAAGQESECIVHFRCGHSYYMHALDAQVAGRERSWTSVAGSGGGGGGGGGGGDMGRGRGGGGRGRMFCPLCRNAAEQAKSQRQRGRRTGRR